MKRAIAVMMCLAIVVTLLGVTAAPVAAAIKQNSFSCGGATVNYLVKAWREDGELRGLTAATLRPDRWTSATLKIAAGVAVTVDDPERPDAWWYTFPAYASQKTLSAGPNGLKTDMVYAPEGFTARRSNRIYLRMLLVSKWPWPPIVKGIDARCWTWRDPDDDLTRDDWTELQLEAPEHGFAVVGALLFISDLGWFL